MVLFKTKGITKKFSTGFTALSDINMEIYEGECLVIAGANGSGKTLLMRIITGLIEASGGEVLYKNENIKKCIPLLRRSVGLIFQDPDAQIIGDTVEDDIRTGLENFKLPKYEIEERVNEEIKSFNLEEKRNLPPRRLSGGEKRRLAAAAILATGCETVIMDEPFANLDWPGVKEVLNIVIRLKAQGKTIIILTHELEKILSFADRLLILVKGCVKDAGKPVEVLDRMDESWGVRDPRQSYKNVEDCTWL